jgi:hypothetical protein
MILAFKEFRNFFGQEYFAYFEKRAIYLNKMFSTISKVKEKGQPLLST